MAFPIDDPVPVFIERETKDRIASYKAKNKMNVRNMDSVLVLLMDHYDATTKHIDRGKTAK